MLCGDNRIRAREHVGDGVRFADHFVDAGLVVIFFGDHFCIAGGDDHGQVGTKFFDPARDLQSAQFGKPRLSPTDKLSVGEVFNADSAARTHRELLLP